MVQNRKNITDEKIDKSASALLLHLTLYLCLMCILILVLLCIYDLLRVNQQNNSDRN